MRYFQYFRLRVVWLLICGLALVPIFVGCQGQRSPRFRNVILIVIDTLRADVLGCYGGAAHTPNIDRLAAEGLRFSHARSHIPITGPSHSSLFTSLWPQEHGFTNNAMQLPEHFATMAQLLRGRDMHTAGFVSLGVLKGKFGFSRGFDSFADRFETDWFRSAGEMNKLVENYLKDRPRGRQFLWVHYSDPHEPYQDPDSSYPDFRVDIGGQNIGQLPANGRRQAIRIPLLKGEAELQFMPGDHPFEVDTHLTISNAKLNTEGTITAGNNMSPWVIRQRSNNFVCDLPAELNVKVEDTSRAFTKMHLSTGISRKQSEVIQAYIREVEYADRQLGLLLARLRADKLLDHALLIFTADHGEGLGDHRLGGHIEQLYDSLLHVPLIFWAPGRVPAGVVDDRTVGLVDVLPTVAGMTGIEADPNWRGVDLLADQRTRTSLPLIAATYQPEAKHNLEAIVDGHFKFIRNRDDGSIELYDLEKDPQELKNIAKIMPVKASDMQARMDELLDGVEAPPSQERVLDEETRDQLRALGYAD